MKYLTLISIVLLISCTRQVQISCPESIVFKGNVKTIKETSYLIHKDSDQNIEVIREARKKEDIDDYISHFDKEGRKTSTISFNKTDTLKKIFYKYEDNYNLHISEEKQNGDLIRFSHLYRTKNKQSIAKITTNGKDMILSRQQFFFNNQDQLTKEMIYYAIGDLAFYKLYFYNNLKNLTEVHWFNPNDEILKRITYKYNSRNDIIIETHFLGYDEIYIEWEYEYVYDAVGNWVSRIDYYEEVPQYKIVRDLTYF